MEYKILVTVVTDEIENTEGKEKIVKINVTEEEGAIDVNWQEKCHSLIIAAETIAKNNDASVLDILPVVTEFLESKRKEEN